MKKGVITAKKMLAILLCFVTAFSCFAISGVFAADHVHSYDEWEIITAATCKAEGLKRKTCIVCNQSIEDIIPISSKAHALDENAWTVTEEAKCIATGERANTCTLCGEIVTDKLPKKDHTFDESKWEITKHIVHGINLKTENGFKINFCTVCNEKVTQTIEVEHTFDDTMWKASKVPTCTEKGVEFNTCTVCGDIISREMKIDPENHTFSSAPYTVVAPTCISAGSGYNRCDGCCKVMTVEIPIDYDNLQHTFDYNDSHIVDCQYVHYFCTTCKTYLQPDTEHPHTVASDGWTILANSSCTTKGIKQGTCMVCEVTFTVRTPIEEGAHTYDRWTNLITPTCEKEGLRVRNCINNYGHKQYETLDILPHTYKTDWTVVTEATCVAEGSKTNYCVACENTITEIIPIDTDAHDFTGDWVRTKDPTCTEEGSETNECTRCGDVTRAIPKHTDTYEEYDRREPDCTYEGRIYLVCTECSATTVELIPVVEGAHGYFEKTPATCSKEGLEVCRFNSAHTRAIPVNPEVHTYPDDWAYPTDCSQAGERTKTCTGCGDTISESYTPGHTVGPWTYVIGNCTSGGTMTKHCTRCGKLIEERNGVAGEHALEVVETVAPSCTTDGYDLSVCTYCGAEEHTNIVMTHGHQLIVVEPGLEATCTTDGYKASVRCIACDYKNSSRDVIPAIGHNFVLQENGTYSCTNCYEHLVNGDEDNPKTCGCFCHNQDGLAKFLFKIVNLLYKMFGVNQFCECGVKHYEDTSIFEDLFGDFDIDLGGAHGKG